MPQCCVFGCKNNEQNKMCNFFSFPNKNRNPKVYRQWIEKIKRSNFIPTKNSRVCSVHFKTTDFDESALMKKKLLGSSTKCKMFLKKDAVPSLLLYGNDNTCEQSSRSNLYVKRKEQKEVVDNAIASTSTNEAIKNDKPASCSMEIMETDINILENEVGIQCELVNESFRNISYNSSNNSKMEEDYECQEYDYLDQSDSEDELSEKIEEDRFESLQEHNSYFMVYFESLQNLFSMIGCKDYGLCLNLSKIATKGCTLLVTFSCTNDHSFVWKSSPTENYYSHINLQLASAIYISGMNFSTFQTMWNTAGIQLFSNTTFYSVVKKFVMPSIKEIWRYEKNNNLLSLKGDGENCALAGDGQFDSPGFSAKYVTYSLMDLKTDKVVDFLVLQRGQVDGELEKQACDRLLSKIEDTKQKINLFLSDRHTGIRCMLRQKYPHIEHQFDVWHLSKSLVKKLKSVEKKAPLLGPWRASIVNHLWWSASTCNGDVKILKEKFLSLLHHVSNKHSWEGNEYFHQCEHSPISEEAERDKLWISSNSNDYQYLKAILEDKRFLQDLEHINKYCHTGLLESYHNVRLKYRPKRIHFSYDGMVARSILAVLDHNENVKRPKCQERVQWSKSQKKWVYKEIPGKKSHEWRKQILSKVHAYVISSTIREDAQLTDDEYHIEVPTNLAPTQRPTLEEARSAHFSRFSY